MEPVQSSEQKPKQDRDASPQRHAVEERLCPWCGDKLVKEGMLFGEKEVCGECFYSLNSTECVFRNRLYNEKSCENCDNDYCLNFRVISKCPDDAYQCCACDNRRNKRTDNTKCYPCYRRDLPRRRWIVKYAFLGLGCDMPVLESLWFGRHYEQWHEHIADPGFNHFVILTRRLEYDLLAHGPFNSNTLSEFCRLLVHLKENSPYKIENEPTIVEFATRMSLKIVASIGQDLSTAEGIRKVFVGALAARFFGYLADALEVALPGVLELLAPKIHAVVATHLNDIQILDISFSGVGD